MTLDEMNKQFSTMMVSGLEEDDATSRSSSPASSSSLLHLRWSRLHKTVQVSGSEESAGSGGWIRRGSSMIAGATSRTATIISKKGETTKTILSSVSGSAAPGSVLCLMGPSGSGKTTLLNCLSGRTQYTSGIITVNGAELTPHKKKRLMTKIAYVKQADIFFTHLSVRDQLMYTAFLRLPQAWTKERKLQEVEKILTLLRLEKVADSEIRLLSGGEKKRTNIGTELLTDPSCLLLDEPTSGLDSTSAVSLMQLLQSLARSHNKTVITSIHQPSSKVFFSFDRLMLLAEGNAVYFGTPKDSLEYLRNHNMPCPDGYNAADHWMDLLVSSNNNNNNNITNTSKKLDATELTVDVEENAAPSSEPNNRILIEAWDNDAIAIQIDQDAKVQLQQNVEDDNNNNNNVEKNKKKRISKYNTSWAMQYRVLVHRALKNSRSAIFTPLNMIKSAVLGLMVGLLYYQMPYTESTVYDRNSFFFFAMTYWVFDAMFNALMAFPMERTVILKERSSGAYHLSAYFMAKTTSEMPMRMALPSIYMTISFWMAGISPKASLFFLTTFISLLSVIAGESIGLMVGASIYDMEKAMTTMTVASLGLMLLGGFFIENVPVWLAWGQYVSPFKYSFDASRQLVFDRDVPCDGSGALESLCGGSDTGFAKGADVADFLGVKGSVAFNALLLLVLGLVPRYIAYLALRAKKETDR